MALSKIQTTEMLDAPNLGRRNLFINGDMRVAQRGTSFTSQTGVAYHLDRWETQAYNMSTGVYRVDQSTESPDGFYYSTKISCTTADASQDADNQIYFGQQIEAQDIYGLKFYEASPDSVTISFYVRSNLTGTFAMTLKLSDNNSSDGNSATRIYPTSFSISTADTWERITKTITLDSDTGQTRPTGTNFGMAVIIWLAAGSSRQGNTANAWRENNNQATTGMDNTDFNSSTDNEFFITGFQVEKGSQVTPFEHRSYGEQLALCQRYFVSETYYAQGYMSSGLDYSIQVTHPVTMRSSPTRTLGTQNYFSNVSNVQIATTPSGTGVQYTRVYCTTSSTGNVEFGHDFTLDAEL